MTEIQTDSENQQLPKNFIDVLLTYAIDPTQWEQVARELHQHESSLSRIDPTEFLTSLSQAEALAWHLGSGPGKASAYYHPLDRQGNPIQDFSHAAEMGEFFQLRNSCWELIKKSNAAPVKLAMARARKLQRPTFLQLKDVSGNIRVGYITPLAELQTATQIPAGAEFAFFLAPLDIEDRVRRVLEVSFGFTRAEADLCICLLKSDIDLPMSLVAQQLGSAEGQAVAQLQSTLDRTGLKNRSELLLMTTQLAVLLARGASVRGSQDNTADYPEHQFAIIDATSEPRRLAYRTYGSGQHCVIYFHESAGTSRLPPGTAMLADRHDLRIIAIERPGFGFSDPASSYNFDALARDMCEFVDQMDFAKVHLLGFLSGGAHALCSAALLREAVGHVMLVAARGPIPYARDEATSLAVLRRKLIQQPWLLKTFFNILRSRANEQSVAAILKRIYGVVADDRSFLKARPDILNHMTGYALESLSVTVAGLVGEISCFSNPTFVNLMQISANLTVWHGEEDQIASIEQLRQSLVGLNYSERLFNGQGSLLMYAHWEDILAQLATDIARTSQR